MLLGISTWPFAEIIAARRLLRSIHDWFDETTTPISIRELHSQFGGRI